MMRIDLVAPAIGSPFRGSLDSQPLRRPFVRPVTLYSSKDHSILGYRIGIFDDAVRPEVEWIGLQNVAMGKGGAPVLIANLEDWDKVVREHLGEYIADG